MCISNNNNNNNNNNNDDNDDDDDDRLILALNACGQFSFQSAYNSITLTQ